MARLLRSWDVYSSDELSLRGNDGKCLALLEYNNAKKSDKNVLEEQAYLKYKMKEYYECGEA